MAVNAVQDIVEVIGKQIDKETEVHISICYPNELEKHKSVPIYATIKVWMRRFVCKEFESHVDAEGNYIFEFNNTLNACQAEILIEQLVERGFPKRAYWTLEFIL